MASTSIFRDLFAIRKGEWSRALLMSFYFFLVIAVFWILKPIKKALLVTYYNADHPFILMGQTLVGGEVEQIAKILNMLVAFVASVMFAYLSRKFVRQALVVVVHIFFVLTLFTYANLVENPSTSTVWSFYLYGDLWSTLNVALFFAFLNDLVNTDQAKRLYGIIGLGGVVGGAVGSNFSGFFIKAVGAPNLLLVSVGLNILIIASAVWVGRLAHKRTVPDDSQTTSKESSITEGAKLVFGSRYLLSIMGIVALYEIVSTIMDFQFTQGVLFHARQAGWDRDATGAFFGKVFGVTNIIALIIQLFFTGIVMRKLGVGIALMALPAMAFLGTMGFMLVPFLYTAAFLSVIDNSFNYSINQSAKEALYVPTAQAVKYRAKGFIDIFIQRAAKTVGVLFNLTIPGMIGANMTGVRYLSVASLLLLGFWIYLAIFAGRQFNALSASQDPD